MLEWKSVKEICRSENIEPAYRGGKYTLPIPNFELRASSSIGDLDMFYAIGEAWAQITSYYLPTNPSVLDVGCNCGKLARFLYLNPQLSYTGLDIYEGAIKWCQEHFKHLAGDRFKFIAADVYSALYNPQSKISAKDYEFPLANDSFDMIVAASLFTHLLEPDAKQYLREFQRVLRPGGKALISIHVDVPEGRLFTGDETRIDVDPKYFMGLAKKAGLKPTKIIGFVYGQDLILFEKSG